MQEFAVTEDEPGSTIKKAGGFFCMVPNFSLNVTCEKSLKEQDDSHGKTWGKNLNKIGIW
ncbi:hypothetical protein [Bacillus velezensis]|uniref:hypothetical protein n=1 Tax=Bacillus velezensis TaxID=492670 RepID=UPI000BA6AE2C|nr:hypothetical protein [Bacillus velezensis]PAF01839.1 hypothetical protein CHH68_07095 [Bacillus velezensis]